MRTICTLRDRTCCYTGHRPDKLGGYNWNSLLNIKIRSQIRSLTINLIENYDVYRFIFGGALGFDQFSFEVVYKLKKTYPFIELILAIPFDGFHKNWIDKKDQERLFLHMKLADEVVNVNELSEYYKPNIKKKYDQRNMFMVDKSSYIIGCWDGSSGGTKNCIDYATLYIRKENTFLINPNKL